MNPSRRGEQRLLQTPARPRKSPCVLTRPPVALAAPRSPNRAGYVSLAFAQTPNRMAPADAVLGWRTASGNVLVDTYRISNEQSLTSSETNPWALLTGVTRVGSTLIVCFTRALAEPNATVSATLDPTRSE